MNSVIISWGLFLTLAGGVYWVYLSPRSAATKLHSKPIVEDKGASGIFLNASGTEGAEKKKRKKKKPAPSNTAPKDTVSIDDRFKAAESTDDDDIAQEEDQAELLRRLQTLRDGSGGKKSASASSSTRQLAPQKPALVVPTSPFATASQTSSAGADADIDEEEATRLPGSDYASQQSLSSDPSDMLESSTSGPGVLKITSSAQLPRPLNQKTTSAASQSGVHSNKNAKKKEKKKSEKETEKADQKARFELHRATMRAAEIAKQKSKPLQSITPPSSAWATSGQAPSTAPKSATDGLLDTFAVPVATGMPTATQQTTTDSEEEKQQMRSTHLDDSYWEEIPEHLIGGWNEVQKKGRKQKKAAGEVQTGDESTDARSGKESLHSKPSARVPSRAPSKAVKPVVSKKVTPAGGNGFQLLDTGSTTSNTNTNNSSSDWAEVDDLDNWAVHPEEYNSLQ